MLPTRIRESCNVALQGDARGRTVLIEERRIEHLDVGPAHRLAPRMISADCAGTEIRAGRVNAHTHIYSGLAPLGLPAPEPPPQSFLEILERIWWRLDRALDERALRASARLYVAEALLAGTTTLVDHHESPAFIEGSLDVLAETCEALGMRALLCYGATERNGGADEARRGLEECARLCARPSSPLIRGCIGLHASFTVSDETLARAGALCRELKTVLHVHLAEDAADVLDAQRRGYRGPAERVLAVADPPAGSIFAHGVHLDRAQVQALSERGIWLVHNPRSNAGNRVGYARALGASEHVALGTDGYPAQMVDEVAALREQARLAGDALDDSRVAQRADAGSRLVAQRFGLALGLQVGATADLIAISDDDGHARHVVIDGHLVVRDGRLVSQDIEEIRATAEDEARRLWARMRKLA